MDRDGTDVAGSDRTREATVETTSVAQAAATIDHALLRPELDLAGVEAGCALAARYAVVAVCCRPADVAACARWLAGSPVKVTTVIGFPHGANHPATKVFEAEQAMADGAVELDVVCNIGRLRSGASSGAEVQADLAGVIDAAHRGGATVKVILENAYLTDEEKVLGCRLAEAAGADYVKTSTGFAPSSATLHDVALMRGAVSAGVGLKAAGGVRTLDDLLAFLAAGCTRVGTSATATLLDDLAARRVVLGLTP